MKMWNEEVLIVTDRTLRDNALAVRSMLECWQIPVRLVRVVQKEQLLRLLRDLGAPQITILMLHGAKKPEPAVEVTCVHNPTSDDPQAASGWEEVKVHITAERVREWVGPASGWLLLDVCGGAHPDLVTAFQDVGFSAVIGEAEGYHDCGAGQMFILSLIYFLLAEDRDYAPQAYDLPAAVERARHFDAGWSSGTEGFQLYERTGST